MQINHKSTRKNNHILLTDEPTYRQKKQQIHITIEYAKFVKVNKWAKYLIQGYIVKIMKNYEICRNVASIPY